MDSKFQVDSGVYFLSALWILVLPHAWGLGALLAIAVHELGHLLAIMLCGGKICSVRLMPLGIEILTMPMGHGREALCAMAGPAASFSLLLVAEFFPEAAICAFAQGVYNLFPIYPLDGGRISCCLLPREIFRAVEAAFLTLLTGISLWMVSKWLHMGLFLLIAVWIPAIRRKSSCKERILAVQ